MPKISIITPIYKTKNYLEKCLQSQIGQSLGELEFIWIDNGADEACRQIITKYDHQRPNIKVIHLQDNIGYSGALNLGLTKATGDFVAFCDSDDWLDKDYYERLYSAADKNTEIIYCNYILEDRSGSKKYVHLLRPDLPKSRGALLTALPTGTIWNALFNTQFIKNNNIHFSPNKNSTYKDIYFAVQAAWLAKNVKIATDVYYHYVQHVGSTTDISRRKQTLSACELIQEICSLGILKGAGSEEIETLTDFLMRAIPWVSPESLPSDCCFRDCYTEKYKHYRAFSYPSFWQRIFSISEHYSKPYKKIRFLGFNFKLKQKKGTL